MSRRYFCLAFVGLLLMLVTFSVRAQEDSGKLTVVVYLLEPHGISEAISEIMTSAIVDELSLSKKLGVRDEKNTRAVLLEKGLAQSGHCDDESCKIDQAKLIMADKIVLGSIGKLGERKYVVSIRLTDTKGSTEYPLERRCRNCSAEMLLDEVKLMAGNLRTYLETGKKTELPSSGATSLPSGDQPAAGKGALTVKTNPAGALIYVDAEPKGQTPATIKNLKAGAHRLTLVLEGFETINKGIAVKKNQTATIKEMLVRQTGMVRINSNPKDAQVWVDGKYVGKTPVKVPGLNVGSHNVRVSLPSYRNHIGRFRVDPNTLTPLDINLKGKPGKLLVTSMPTGAHVHIEGEKVGATPYSARLKPDEYSVVVSKQGYTSVHRKVELIPDRSTVLELVLKKGLAVTENMVNVPAGRFMMGCNKRADSDCDRDELASKRVYLDSFYIDKYEVTVERYRQCVNAGSCDEPRSREDSRFCNWGHPERGAHPVNCVTWSMARDYCKWAGKRLPTEAEWERAARGTDGRKYPWGNDGANCNVAIMKDKYGGCGEFRTWPVGSKPKGASPSGAMDMAGNVWEWTASWYRSTYRTMGTRNPRGPSSGKYRVVRGGGYNDTAEELRVSNRDGGTPGHRLSGYGFRCAK